MKPDVAKDGIDPWVPMGALGAIALAVALTPLRTLTPASNLAFVFVAFTIVVAELGGRRAALATAVVGAMSLNFFLTEPYLTLAITKRDDIIAFVAMAVCGLIASAFGRRRERWSTAAGRAREDLDILKQLSGLLRAGRPLGDVLEALRAAFGLRAVALRGDDDRVLASAPFGLAPSPAPSARLDPETFIAPGEGRQRIGDRGLRLPEAGGRVRVDAGAETFWLDLWEGDSRGYSVDESQTLAIAVAILSLELARRPAGERSATPRS